MRKLNNKGFMMAEVVVVASVVLVALTGLYISYNKVISTYQERITYNDINTFYKLAFYRDRLFDNINSSSEIILNENNKEITNKINDKDFIVTTGDRCFIYTSNNLNSVEDANKKFNKYINYLNKTVKISGTIMVLEECINNECTYAYIDITEKLNSLGTENEAS